MQGERHKAKISQILTHRHVHFLRIVIFTRLGLFGAASDTSVFILCKMAGCNCVSELNVVN